MNTWDLYSCATQTVTQSWLFTAKNNHTERDTERTDNYYVMLRLEMWNFRLKSPSPLPSDWARHATHYLVLRDDLKRRLRRRLLSVCSLRLITVSLPTCRSIGRLRRKHTECYDVSQGLDGLIVSRSITICGRCRCCVVSGKERTAKPIRKEVELAIYTD